MILILLPSMKKIKQSGVFERERDKKVLTSLCRMHREEVYDRGRPERREGAGSEVILFPRPECTRRGMQRPEVGMNLQPQGWEDGKQAPKEESRKGRS